MADGVGPLKVDDGEIRTLAAQPLGRKTMVGLGFDQDAHQSGDRVGVGVRAVFRGRQLSLGQLRQVGADGGEIGLPLGAGQGGARPTLAIRRKGR